MWNPLVLASILAASFVTTLSAASSNSTNILTTAGDQAIVPGWYMLSSQNVTSSLDSLSITGVDTSTWYRVEARGSVFAGLLNNNVYNDSFLFFSDNLETAVDYSEFEIPWLFREEFSLSPQAGQHYFLQTHGITSRADIYLNGVQIATNETQVGAYGGRRYEITDALSEGSNAILIVAYPTNYLRDFAMGYVDWNPYPPDNGTGVWRYVELVQSDQVSLSPPRIKTDFEYTWKTSVLVTVRTDVTNNGNQPVNATITATIQDPDGSEVIAISQLVSLLPGQVKTVSISSDLAQPQIWWPASWGSQPLYSVSVNAAISGTVSDVAPPLKFGIRHVSSYVNSYNDTAFIVNGHPFLVMGAGYTSDVFYRFDLARTRTQFQRVLDMGLNTIRLEGKQEHPEMYELADEMGLMIMAGWECCDKWEGWDYNDEADGVLWDDADYSTANISMLHEAAMMQTHPSMLAFLVGSDFWPDERAVKIYVDALDKFDWPNPIIASAAKRGYPEILGPSGMKMDGPYDWVPPNYWYGDELGAAFGFGSELGAGVGTPEMASLIKFLSEQDLEDLWTAPDKGLYHMSTDQSSFYDRSIYNGGLYNRYGEPTSLEDYLLKAQLSDYESTRAQFEAYSAYKGNTRPSTGLIYWMLQGAWPNLHWQLFDYYEQPMGSYYGVKVATRPEHVIFDYEYGSVWVTSNSLNSSGTRTVAIDLISLNGTDITTNSTTLDAVPNGSTEVADVDGIDSLEDVTLLKLELMDENNVTLSRNVYWIPTQNDVMNWTNSSWYHTPVVEYANLTALFTMDNASVSATASNAGSSNSSSVDNSGKALTLENTSDIPAVFIRLRLVQDDVEVETAYWNDNYVTIWPHEKLEVSVNWEVTDGANVSVIWNGVNVPQGSLQLH
jgi:exo-1,4-beta-D-glucosaminidase